MGKERHVLMALHINEVIMNVGTMDSSIIGFKLHYLMLFVWLANF